MSILINTVAQTESQNPGNTGIGADVFDVLPIVDGTATTLGAHGANTDVKYYSTGNSLSLPIGTGLDTSVGIASANTIELNQAPPEWLQANGLEIRVLCGSKEIGTYVITGMDPSGNDITVTETMPMCNTGAGMVAGDSDTNLNIHLVTPWAVTKQVDVSSMITPDQDYLKFGTGFTGAGSGVMPLVKAVTYPSYATGSDSSVFFFWPSAADTADGAAGLSADAGVYLYSTGQKESSQCSDRGVCDRNTGICDCFKGYTGEACELQNSLAM